MSSDTAILILKWLNFLLLTGLIYNFGKSPLLSLLDSWIKEEVENLEQSRKELTESEGLVREGEEKLKNVEQEILKIKTKAEVEGEMRQKEIREETEREIERLKGHIDLEINKIRTEALVSIQQEIIEESVELSKKMLKNKINSSHKKKFIEEFITLTGETK